MAKADTNTKDTRSTTPFDETFDDVDIEAFDEAYEETKLKPLRDGKYQFEIDGGENKPCYAVSKVSSQGSKIDGFLSVRFGCRVVEDSDPENNGRYVSIDFIVQGFMFQGFLDFSQTVSPKATWKKTSRLVSADGSSDVFILLDGNRFQADIEEQKDKDTGDPTGYNQVVGSRTKDFANHIYNLNNETMNEIHLKLNK